MENKLCALLFLFLEEYYSSYGRFLQMFKFDPPNLYICSHLITSLFCLWHHNLTMPCRDIQKATQNFTTILGQGSFGPVYKAIMPTGAVVAVKVLANKSKQGEKEFQTEVCLSAYILMSTRRDLFFHLKCL